jgi:hypothetical protein
MAWGATTLGRRNRITFADSPYTAVEGEIVECDTTAGDILVNTPAIGVGGKRFTVKKVSNDTNVVSIATTDQIESKITGDLIGGTIVAGKGECITWYADELGTAWRIHANALDPDYVEAFIATPAAVGVAAPIAFTFAPLYPGQTQVLTNYAAGTFTCNFDVPLNLELALLWHFNLVGNNEDASGRSDLVFSGVGLNLFLAMSFPFSHTRSGDFYASQSGKGTIGGAAADTFRFDAADDPGQVGNTLINAGILFVGTG